MSVIIRIGKLKLFNSSQSVCFLFQIMDDYYSFRHNKVSKRSKFPSRYYHDSLAKDPNVSRCKYCNGIYLNLCPAE